MTAPTDERPDNRLADEAWKTAEAIDTALLMTDCGPFNGPSRTLLDRASKVLRELVIPPSEWDAAAQKWVKAPVRARPTTSSATVPGGVTREAIVKTIWTAVPERIRAKLQLQIGFEIDIAISEIIADAVLALFAAPHSEPASAPTREGSHRTCGICGESLDLTGRPWSLDCGGDCAACMAEAGDPDCIDSIKSYWPYPPTGLDDPPNDKLRALYRDGKAMQADPPPSPVGASVEGQLRSALKLAKDMFVANDVSVPYTFAVIDAALALTPQDGVEQMRRELKGAGQIVDGYHAAMKMHEAAPRQPKPRSPPWRRSGTRLVRVPKSLGTLCVVRQT